MRALIVVDYQNDFSHQNGALYVPGANSIYLKSGITELIRKFSKEDLIVMTQDWHPNNHVSFADNNGAAPFETIELVNPKTGEKYHQTMWPRHCVENSLGSMLSLVDTELFFSLSMNYNKEDILYIKKGTDPAVDSYSAFYDNQRINKTELSEKLRAAGVTQCYFCGLAFNYCVGWSALDAVDEGFESFIIMDATRGILIGNDSYNEFIRQLIEKGVKLIYSSDI